MNTATVRQALIAFGLMGGIILAPLSPLWAATARLKPLAYVTLSGSDSGNPVAAMRVRDQSGAQNDPVKYIVFKTPATVYKGTRKYKVPGSVALDAITALTVRVNFKGPAPSQQVW